MKHQILCLALLLIPFSVNAQEKLPIYGTPEELISLHKVYVTSDEPSSRAWVLSELKKYEGLSVVSNPDDAEFILDCEVKSSTESRGRQPSHYMRTLLTAYSLDKDGRRHVLWTDTETYEQRDGFSFSRPNEVNLTRHFVSLMRKLRGEKK